MIKIISVASYILKPFKESQSKSIVFKHVYCWAIFIIYELSVLYYSVGSIEKPYVYLVYYIINIGFFYCYIGLLNFTFNSFKVKYIIGFLSCIVLFTLYLFLKSIADYVIDSRPTVLNHPLFFYIKGFLPRNIIRAFYFAILATFYWSAGHISYFRRQAQEAEKLHLIAQKEKAELETQLAKSRNAYLQQQIKPHILFNTLNFVYSSAQKYSDDAAHCVWLLAEIMRFSLEEPDFDGKINLDREVEQIKNMLALNRYRFEKPLYISVEMKGDFSNFQIIPLILLTLTENIFKHGNLTETDQPATLSTTIDEAGKLIFFSRNLKKPKNKHPRRQQALGLENVRIRLDTTYAGNYKLDISEPGEFYELTLTLNL